MSTRKIAFGHYQEAIGLFRAALQPRAETFPFPRFSGRAGWRQSTGLFFRRTRK
jgi:hypothetical protein